MTKLEFYPVDVTYKITEDKPVIYMFGRTKAGERICVIDERFMPYFYVLPKKGENTEFLIDRLKRLESKKRDDYFRVIGAEFIDRNFLGSPMTVIKVYANTPAGVPVLREEIRSWNEVENIYEADILFVRRYLIDRGIVPMTLTEVEGDFASVKSRVPVFKAEKIMQSSNESLQPRILAFDIETYNPSNAIDMEKNPIIMVSFYAKDFQKVITWKRFNTKLNYVEFVDGEAELIERFARIIEEYGPDLIAGYFSDGFDWPYIKARADKYRIRLDLGWDYSLMKLKAGKAEAIQMNGPVSLDIFKHIDRVVSRKLRTDSKKLGDVAQELIGKGKTYVDMDKFAEVWDEGSDELEEYCKYNYNDSLVAYELTEALLPNLVEMVKIVGQPIYDVNMMSMSQLVEWYLMRQAPSFNELAPNRPSHDEIKKRRMQTYMGAFVFEPKPGLFHDIIVFDFRSLYPSIIASHNVSPSSLNCSCCADTAEMIPEIRGKMHYWFCQKKKGFMSYVIEDIIARRMRVKEIMKTTDDETKQKILDARQDGLKLLSNSFYGYFGFFGARWYSIECARATTAYARFYIKDVINKAQDAGFEVLYSDTDSIFMLLHGKDRVVAKKFIDKINLELPKLMELEYEGYYTSGLFVAVKEQSYGAKKKYALLSKDGHIKIKGFEMVRRNWSFVAKDVQEEVIRIILQENDVEKALNFVKDTIKDLKQRKVPLSKVVIHTQLQKPIAEYENVGPHVAVAKRMQDSGEEVGPGSMIKYVVVQGTGKIRDRAKMPDEVMGNEYDYDYYINNQVLPAVESIFSVLGHKKEELVQPEQSKLGGFF